MYYTLQNGTGKEAGNVFPQVSCQSLKDAHELGNDFPNFNPELIFELQKKAKLTDVLSQAAITAFGFLISPRLKSLFEKFNLMDHKFYPAIIKTSKGDLNYYWLHFSQPNLVHQIDYDNSSFYYTKFGFQEDYIKIKSFEDYQNKKKEHGAMWGVIADTIKLSKEFDPTIDLFTFIHLTEKIYISERLQAELIENKISGFEILPAINIQLK